MNASPRPSLTFTRLEKSHIPEIMPIEREAYPEPWTIGMFHQDAVSPSACFYVAHLDGQLVGYVGMWVVIDEAHITSVTVHQAYRRRGLGRMLLEYILNVARHLGLSHATLEVRETNIAAQRLYYSMGFQHVGRRKEYYSKTREDAIIMLKELAHDAPP
ncbi:MAG: ribosomal protein S18-alanine N-acetyltransferase [Nitrospiraceae bacterium]|nr:ribosomal protein S18-alanine N-acetyltransferase [Nitrospiraceae bacterium]